MQDTPGGSKYYSYVTSNQLHKVMENSTTVLDRFPLKYVTASNERERFTENTKAQNLFTTSYVALL